MRALYHHVPVLDTGARGATNSIAQRGLGVAAFVHTNDQNLLKTAAAQALKDYGDPAAW